MPQHHEYNDTPDDHQPVPIRERDATPNPLDVVRSIVHIRTASFPEASKHEPLYKSWSNKRIVNAGIEKCLSS